jgi:uncharacterized SAM-binding protein YcdF (DUF218 family)
MLFLGLLTVTVLLWLGRWKVSRGLVTLITLGLAVLIFVPLGSLLLKPLEQRFPAGPLPSAVHGIILLGGAQQPRLSATHGQAALNERAERMTTFLALARRYPRATLLASGGSADPNRPGLKEADTTRMFLNEQGFNADRVLFETHSRNTHEHAVFGKAIVNAKPGETWLLITSAADLPRAVGVFRKVGWAVVAVPCDYNTLPFRWELNLSLLGELRLLHHGVHEWLGLIVYYLTDRTDELFPAPAAKQASAESLN